MPENGQTHFKNLAANAILGNYALKVKLTKFFEIIWQTFLIFLSKLVEIKLFSKENEKAKNNNYALEHTYWNS